MKPFFTIITATYNAAATLPRLLDSLAAQTCRDFELIIQDGASTDNTVAVAEFYRDKLPALSLASEPDTGIYDAWNKALNRIRGEWVLFLGADDELTGAIALSDAQTLLYALPDGTQFAAASLYLTDTVGKIRRILTPSPIEEAYTWMRKGRMPFPHSSLFHHNSIFMHNKFDPSFRILGDYDFICRIFSTEKTTLLHLMLTNMYGGGISENPMSTYCVRKESLRIVKKYFKSDVNFLQNVLPFYNGCIIQCIYFIFGQKYGSNILDFFRIIRGLPPVWSQRTSGRP